MTELFELAGVGGFVRALAGTGQLDGLCSAAPFTILAPSDEALAELPRALLDQPRLLARLLAFHIVPGELVDRQSLAREPELTTATGQRVYAELDDEGAVRVDGAQLLRADIRVGAGIVHQVDQVLVPAELDLAELLHLSDSFPRLLTAIEVLELEPLLRGDQPHTLLAPRGLERLPTWEWHRLLRGEARAELEALIHRHLVAGRIYLDPGACLLNLEGERLELGGSRARPTIAGRALAVRDIEARNGIIHVIDGLLGP
jgi:uncharacterized surface protein with fasciclin (FAS1) repeats